MSLPATVLPYLALPGEITRYERVYLERMNRYAQRLFLLAIPLLAIFAWRNQTGAPLALELATALAAGPWLAMRSFDNPRAISMVHGVAAMGLAALVVHFGQGPAQVEMHFSFFVLLALLVAFANPLVILGAAATVVTHHLVFFLWLPRSLLNYAAPAWVIGVHAGFFFAQSVACCVIARSFFDNVIGLEKTVRTRTLEIERKTRDLEMLLDNVAQGFVTLTLDGVIIAASAAFHHWFPGDRTDTFFDRLECAMPAFGSDSRVAWEQVVADFLPLQLTLAQMPGKHAAIAPGGRVYRFSYLTVEAATSPLFVAVVSDITSEVEREKAETDKREGLLLVHRVLSDRASVVSFVEDGSRIVEELVTSRDLPGVKRALHTLKGNAALLGMASVAQACHELETRIEERNGLPAMADVAVVVERFRALEAIITEVLGAESDQANLREHEIRALENLVRRGAGRDAMLRAIGELRLEPVQTQLAPFAERARQLAERLGRAKLHVTVDAGDARMCAHDTAAFWSSFVHLVHNAVDHGIEREDERVAAGKPATASLHLRAGSAEAGTMFVEIEDDGRGIDWERLESRARELGLPGRTSGLKALFADGVSTAGSVDDLSGRGVGMGAFLSAVEALGGTVSVDSTSGVGTRIRAAFPAKAVGARDVTFSAAPPSPAPSSAPRLKTA